jgi:DnaJ-like protein
MTDRKPPTKSWKSWVEDQIQHAQQEGAFDHLEGKGRPIPGIDAPYDPLWWVKKLIEREKLSVLPAALEIRARVDRAVEALWAAATEREIAERVAAINAEIARANRTTANGPPTTLSPLDLDDVLARWRSHRSRKPDSAETSNRGECAS